MNIDTDRNYVLFVTVLASFLLPFIGSSVNIALPSIGKEFAMDAIILSWVATAHLLSSAMFLVPFGRIADIYGRKKIFVYGISIYTVASLLSAISVSAIELILFRVLQGIGSAMVFGSGIAILISTFPSEERGKALGIIVAAVYTGLSLGPILGGVLTENFGWRSIFLTSIPIGLLIIICIFWKLKFEWREAKGEKFDFTGSIIYSLSLVALIYGFSQLPAVAGAGLSIAGVLGIIAFIKWEINSKSPVLNINLLRKNRVFAFSNLTALLTYSATFSLSFILSLYLQYIRILSPQNAGLVLVSLPIMQAVFSPFAGRLSDRIEPRIVASCGIFLIFIGLVLFTFLGDKTRLEFILFSLALLGVGVAFFSSPNTNAGMSSVKNRFYGVASGTLGTMRLIGHMFSMGITMLIFSIYIGRTQIIPENYYLFLRSARIVFLISAILCSGGIFVSLARGKVRPHQRSIV